MPIMNTCTVCLLCLFADNIVFEWSEPRWTKTLSNDLLSPITDIRCSRCAFFVCQCMIKVADVVDNSPATESDRSMLCHLDHQFYCSPFTCRKMMRRYGRPATAAKCEVKGNNTDDKRAVARLRDNDKPLLIRYLCSPALKLQSKRKCYLRVCVIFQTSYSPKWR